MAVQAVNNIAHSWRLLTTEADRRRQLVGTVRFTYQLQSAVRITAAAAVGSYPVNETV